MFFSVLLRKCMQMPHKMSSLWAYLDLWPHARLKKVLVSWSLPVFPHVHSPDRHHSRESNESIWMPWGGIGGYDRHTSYDIVHLISCAKSMAHQAERRSQRDEILLGAPESGRVVGIQTSPLSGMHSAEETTLAPLKEDHFGIHGFGF